MAQHPNTRRLRPGTSLWASPSSLLLILACATLALCFQVLVLNPWHHARAARLRGGWGGPLQNDDDPTFTKTAPCDLLRIEASGLDADAFARLYRGRRPLVLTSSSAPAIFFNRRRWPFVVAPQGWEKAALLARHGHNLTVATGAAEDEDEQDLRRLFSSSAMSEAQEEEEEEGEACPSTKSHDNRLTLHEYTTRYLDRHHDDDEEEDLSSVSWSLAELPRELGAAAVQPPSQFQGWYDGKDASAQQQHTRISLSKSGSGQRWRVHAHDRWSGLLYGGHTIWFVYPPGVGLRNTSEENAGHPLLGSWEWTLGMAPLLAHYDGKGEDGSPLDLPPLRCTQRPGDVVYVPAGWKTLTLHVGQAVAVEGTAPEQEASFLLENEALLQRHPRDVEALLVSGKAHAAQAMGMDATREQQEVFFNQSFNAFRAAALARPCDDRTHLLAAEVLRATGSPQHYQRAKSIIKRAEEDFFTVSSSTCVVPAWVPPRRLTHILAHARLRLARFFVRAGDHAEATRALQEVLALRPNFLAAHQAMVSVLVRQGKEAEARAASAEALQALGPRGKEPQVKASLERLLARTR